MTKDRCYVGKEIDLGPPVPHFDDGDIFGTDTKQGGIRLQHFEISANSDRLRNDGAIVKNKSRHSLQRIDRRVLRRLVLHQHDIDLLGRQGDAFFCQKNARTSGIGGHFAVIEFHLVLRRRTSKFRSTSPEHEQIALSKGCNQSLTRDFRPLLSLVLRNLRNAAAGLCQYCQCQRPINADSRRTTRSHRAATRNISGEAATGCAICARGARSPDFLQRYSRGL